MFKTGYFQIGTWSGRPVRVHWSVLIGMFIFAGFKFVNGSTRPLAHSG